MSILLYESYVQTIDPARRTPVLPRVIEVGAPQKSGRLSSITQRLQTGSYSHWWSFLAGIGVAYLLLTPQGRAIWIGRLEK